MDAWQQPSGSASETFGTDAALCLEVEIWRANWVKCQKLGRTSPAGSLRLQCDSSGPSHGREWRSSARPGKLRSSPRRVLYFSRQPPTLVEGGGSRWCRWASLGGVGLSACDAVVLVVSATSCQRGTFSKSSNQPPWPLDQLPSRRATPWPAGDGRNVQPVAESVGGACWTENPPAALGAPRNPRSSRRRPPAPER